MARYAEKPYTVGEWSLQQRGSTFYRWKYDRECGKVIRASLGARNFEEAKQRLEEWWLQNRIVRDEKPKEASLADIIRRYWEHHAQHLPSKSGNKDALNKWVDYWGNKTVGDLNIPDQEAFVRHLTALNLKKSTVQRTLNIGKAAISRAFKRGELSSMPYIVSVKVGSHPPKGRPMEVAEIAKLYDEAAPHLREFIKWMCLTAARPEAVMSLHSTQIDWDRGIVRLNAEGREQNKKVRPTVRLGGPVDRFEGFAVSFHGDRVKSIKTAWRKARERAGLDDRCLPYSLRHSAARWMRLQGVSGEEVAQQLGHRGMGVTAIYTEYDPEYLRNASAALYRLTCQILATARV